MKPAATENAPAGPPVLSLLLIFFNHWHLLEEDSNLRLTNDGSSTETNWTSPAGGNWTVDGERIGWRPEDEIMDILVALDSSAAEFGQENGNGTQEETSIISDHQDGRHLNGSAKDGEQEANVTVGIGIGTNAASRLKLESELLEQQQQPPVEVEQRLAHNVQPVRYGLRLTLDSESDLVQGQVQVEVQCVEPTDQLQLHMAPDFVQIGHVQLESRLLNRSLAFRSVSADWRVQQLRLRMAEPLERGHVYYLSIWFSAHYAGDGRGLGRNRDKRRGLWLNTLFEPVYARRLFPCWDEPRFRASFRLDLWLLNGLAAEDYVALSGTEGSCQRWHTNLTICQFAPTPPIPTYILSLAVGRFQSVCSDDAGEEANNAPVALDESIESNICIWRLAEGNSKLDGEEMGEEEWKPRARLMVQKMADFQASMLDYLLIHPGGRLHLLVVPLRLSGMENFGLLNVRELLWPLPNETSQRFEKTLYHEMAHQWFGNLVTMEWWDAIWLAESLTTFMSSPRPIVFDASWDLSESAVVMPEGNWLHSAGQHIQLPGLVYTKGAALLEMLDALIGADRMRRLLRDFVRIYQFKAATTGDFLAVLTSILCTDQGNSSGGVNPIDHNGSKSTPMAVHFLDRWLHLPSHPIVFVDFDAQLGQLCFSQTPKMAKHLDRRWPIPVWVECLEASVPGEQLLWIPDHGAAQLVIPLSQLTKMNSTRSLAFNRNRSVYYQISVRWNVGG